MAQIVKNQSDIYLTKSVDSSVKSFIVVNATGRPRTDLTSIFSTFKIEAIARQMSMIEWNYFLLLRSEEFHDAAWMRPDKMKAAPNSISLIFILFAPVS